MNKTSTISQLSTSVTGRRNTISQPAQSPARCGALKKTAQNEREFT